MVGLATSGGRNMEGMVGLLQGSCRGEVWWGLLQGWRNGAGMVGLLQGKEQGTGGRNGGACYKGGEQGSRERNGGAEQTKNGICNREGWNKAQEVDGRGSVELATIRGLPFFQKTYNANRQMMRSWMPSPLLPYSRLHQFKDFKLTASLLSFAAMKTCGDTQIQVAADCCHL